MTTRLTTASIVSATKTAASSSTTATARKRPERLQHLCKELLAEVDRLFADAPPPVAGGLVLDGLACRALDDVLGLGATLSPANLLAAIDRLGTIKIGDIKIPFTPGQLAELQYRAGKRGRTVEAEMRAVVARIEEEIFYKGG